MIGRHLLVITYELDSLKSVSVGIISTDFSVVSTPLRSPPDRTLAPSSPNMPYNYGSTKNGYENILHILVWMF